MATTQNPRSRMRPLRAGLWRPAGLTVATKLYPAVKALIEGQRGTTTEFDRKVGEYLRYFVDSGVGGQNKDSLDFLFNQPRTS